MNGMGPRMEANDIPVMFAQYDREGVMITTEVHANNAHWKSLDKDGTALDYCAENVRHPMDMVERLTRIEIPGKLRKINFHFSMEPSSFTARYWSEKYAGIRDAYEIMYENLKVKGNSVVLPREEGGYILQVHAMWPQGYANYEFHLIPCMRFSQALK